jgi:ferredoxin-NADP reductase
MLNQHKARLVEKKPLTQDVYLFNFRLENNQLLDFSPGQYILIFIPDHHTHILRLYSIASSAYIKNSFELIVKIIPNGKASFYLDNLIPGQEITFSGPAGVFTYRSFGKRRVYFLATGTGIAPILSMLRTLFSGKESVQTHFFLYWGLRYYKDIYFWEELKHFGQISTNFHLRICLSREKTLDSILPQERQNFFLGRINQALIQPEAEEADYYICGSPLVVDYLKTYLQKKGINKAAIYFEKF